ncbi:MAG: hypothetical protein ACD_30C00040G0002 [uncultured bacterium]|uniref:mannose-1-phosphate guanylyltransferase n=4 Tax=Candidatus Daviesiibacteriota TaxID=1752718 RepID=A0A0G0H6Q0_9BACT|nr:MAG: hypothetical protein ACD_30C00040G0002 [uncultured bacterium]KKQ07754.1 MAG: Mannose-1-phosphate guanylyltransferase [Candidatus Daviesbacteria bacterium GW2011_GWB1_36_5]KKQ15058.1 MAG: Mannose-1-phosphate guanylyltransferase [Candidatus Daviesbacteria bacterium GW2011_GWA1_36_8]OGE17130.1 MAG: hypothetical protein A2858_00290 [Candidatus Daviesbacteria bacterium RIFCSPHIGHO2_01_FULL_36_37]OGE32743.1 MAG: hypothetical protein A3C99_00430 [Candidatus Daviesbacteria bacterium RIFCSPHIGHO
MAQPESNFYAVILAGGGGTRLWPKSRKKTPKHLLKLFDDVSLLQIAYKRIAPIVPDENIFVITHIDHAKDVIEELPAIPRKNFIIEPEAKNTAMAMAVASAFIHKTSSDASIIFLAADHIIKNYQRFQMNALASLRVASAKDVIVSIGIKPSFPHTGLGYIKIGKELEEESKIAQKGFVFKVESFKEKPNLPTAQAFLASGQYLWNANLYTWSSKTILKAFEKHCPQIHKVMVKIIDSKEISQSQIDKLYDEVENPNSIDYEVSEKASNIVVIPGDFDWSDVGDWKVVYDLKEKDSNGNVVVEKGTDFVNIGSSNSLIEANGKLIALVGLEDVIIVDTNDALLIVAKDKTQDVKKVVEKLKEEKKDKYL